MIERRSRFCWIISGSYQIPIAMTETMPWSISLNIPNRYIGRKFIQELKDFSSRRGVHLYEGLKSMGIDLVYVRKNVREFVAFMDPLIDDAGNLMPSEVIQLLRSSLDYDRYITDEDIPSPDDVKIANLNQLQLAAARYSSIARFLNTRNPSRTSMSRITRMASRL